MYNGTLKTIHRQATKRYPGAKIDYKDYSTLAKSIKRAQSKINKIELRYSIEQEIQYIESHKFTEFVGLRLGVYGYILAIVVFILSSAKMMKSFKIENPEMFVKYFVWFGVVLFPSLWITSARQNNRLVFLKFELECLNTKSTEQSN